MIRLLGLVIALCSYLVVFSQVDKKADVLVKTNGDQLKGEVVEVTDDNVRFKYVGEQVIYTFKKSDVAKATFGSGRIETFNSPSSANGNSPTATKNNAAATPTAPETSAADNRNKVAILPFSFIKDGQSMPPEASEEIQNECFTRLKEHPGMYTIVSPRTTNVILAKAAIDKSNISKYSMAEICQILGVGYVVDGIINQSNTSESSTGNKSYDLNKNAGKSNNDKISGSSSYSASVSKEYETFTTINIYNDKNENIYSQRRKALFSTVGAYKNTIGYLLKRSPLYTK